MELIHVGATFGDFIWPFILTCIVVYLLGLVMSDGEDWVGAGILAIICGGLLGVVGVAASIDNQQADVVTEFNLTYNVVLLDGDLPSHKNELSAVVLFTQQGREVCVVETDYTRYTVTCDGAELHPGKINER